MHVAVSKTKEAYTTAEHEVDGNDDIEAVELDIGSLHLMAAAGHRTGMMYAGTTMYSVSSFMCGPVHICENFPGH